MNDMVLFDPEPVQSYEEQRGFTHVVVPDKFKVGPTDPPIWGTVLAKGPSCKQTAIHVGSRIVVGKFSVARLELPEGQRHLVREYDVLGVIQ